MGCHSEGVTARRKPIGLVSASSPLLYDVKGVALWMMQDPSSSTAGFDTLFSASVLVFEPLQI